MNPFLPFAAAFVLLALQDPPSPTDDEIRKAFAWFDSIGLPDLSKARFVRVATGWGEEPAEGKPAESHFAGGFLVSEHGDEFTILFPDLQTAVFKKTGSDTPEHKRVGWEKAEIAKLVQSRIDELNAVAKADPDDRNPWRRFGERLDEAAELFVLARGAAGAGEEKAAFELYRFAAARDFDGKKEGKSLADFVAGRIAHAEMWRAVLSSGTRPSPAPRSGPPSTGS
jgi:hypothetical protein